MPLPGSGLAPDLRPATSPLPLLAGEASAEHPSLMADVHLRASSAGRIPARHQGLWDNIGTEIANDRSKLGAHTARHTSERR